MNRLTLLRAAAALGLALNSISPAAAAQVYRAATAAPGASAASAAGAGLSLAPKLALPSSGVNLAMPQVAMQNLSALAPVQARGGLQLTPTASLTAMTQSAAGSAASVWPAQASSVESASARPVQAAQTPSAASASRIQVGRAEQIAQIPSADSAKQARTPLGRTLARIKQTLGLGASAALFDGKAQGMGFLPESGAPNRGVSLNRRPQQPGNTEVPRLSWHRVLFPGAQTEAVTGQSVSPTPLPGNPQDAAGVEAALRELIRRNPESFGGVAPENLETVLSNKVAGREGLADMVYVNFRQRHQTLAVDGTYLDFTVKILNGRAVLTASTAQLYPALQVNTIGRLGEEEVVARALDRLGLPAEARADLRSTGRSIMHLEGRWRSVATVFSQSKTLLAAVDVNTGEAFAWDPRHTAGPEAASGGQISGRGVEFDPANATALDTMPMGHTEVKTSDGRTFFTDAQGFFTLEGKAGEVVTVTARLKGRWSTIKDEAGRDLTVTAQVKAGEQVQLTFNPSGMDENFVAQVNAYRHVNRVHDWLVEKQITHAKIDLSIPVNSNMDQDCNAYYTPWSPSLNFFSSSARCINTAYDTVVYHEYGHFVDDMLGGIVNGALSEGWGDIIGMYITAQPVLGEGFLKNQEKHYIRHGQNTYQFKSKDEVHAQGQAWMGFAWKLRENLVRSLGEARGAALAEALVMPVLFANVRTIPAAIEAVLMRDVGADGTAEHFDAIAAAAKAHGIQLTRPTAGGLAQVTVLSERWSIRRWLSDLITGWMN